MSPQNVDAKIYTIFHPCYIPGKQRLLQKLEDALDAVQFTGGDELSGIGAEEGREQAYQKINNMKDELDGILVFGGYLDHDLTTFGLPVVMVRSIFGVGDWEKGLLNFYKGEKLFTTSLSDFDQSDRISSDRFDDLLEKIRLLTVLKKVKNSKLLLLQEDEILGNYDIQGMDFHVPLPQYYNDIYSQKLQKIGPHILHKSVSELSEEIGTIDDSEAEPIADKWIDEAEKVKETNKEEVLKVAKMYRGLEKLMEKYNADGVSVRSLVPWVNKKLNTTPCLANTELNKQNKVGVCEGLVNSAITEMFTIHITGKPTFIGDVVGIDTCNDAVTFAHCQCPVNVHGDDTVPYILRSHALQNENELSPDDYPEGGPNLGAVVQVDLPVDEKVTSVKMALYDNKMAISHGTSVSGNDFYENFDDLLCRTKLVMKTDGTAFERNYDTACLGVHRNLVYGDHKQTFKNLARLLNFEIIEEDA